MTTLEMDPPVDLDEAMGKAVKQKKNGAPPQITPDPVTSATEIGDVAKRALDQMHQRMLDYLEDVKTEIDNAIKMLELKRLASAQAIDAYVKLTDDALNSVEDWRGKTDVLTKRLETE